MNWTAAETKIYNEALALVEDTNKQLARVYLSMGKEIADKLKKFYLTIDPSSSKQYQAQRLTAIFKEINKRLSVLTGQTQSIIESGYLAEYQNTFNSYDFNLGKYTGILPLSIPSEKIILAGLNEQVAGYSFPKAMAKRQNIFRDKLREEVVKSLGLGEGPLKLAKRIKDTFGQEISIPVRTARTELLRAYSIAQDDTLDQALEMGIEFKYIWRARLDSRVRDSHANENGKKAKILPDGRPEFTVGQSKGSGPRMLEGPDQKRQVINCRCRRLNVPVV